MSKVKFATAYEPNKQVRSKLDRRDNVNRVSYVDSTEYVKRMIYEGQNLIKHRAIAMRSGLYNSDVAIKEKENVPAIPVYESDPVISQAILETYKDEIQSHLGTNNASSGSDKGSSNGEETSDNGVEGKGTTESAE